jgi:hypothetical protein
MNKHNPSRDEDESEGTALGGGGARRQGESAFDPADLNEFLGDIHETSEVEANGMPSLRWIKDTFQTKSAAIRYLKLKGYNAREVANHLHLKYQHVYNVMHQQLKRGPNEVYTETVWQCSHKESHIIVDVIVRCGERDPDSSRILYRVCGKCAEGLIPGVTDSAIRAILPGQAGKGTPEAGS